MRGRSITVLASDAAARAGLDEASTTSGVSRITAKQPPGYECSSDLNNTNELTVAVVAPSSQRLAPVPICSREVLRRFVSLRAVCCLLACCYRVVTLF